MSAPNSATVPDDILYPDSDGKRMAENTLQYEWIVKIQGNLDIWYRHDPSVLVAGDNLIYAVKGKPKCRRAPDTYVAFGRPKGHRGSYQVWKEDNIFPQVVFEVLSPKNSFKEMRKRKTFYEKHGVEEFYIIDPDRPKFKLRAWVRINGKLKRQKAHGFVSPRLGIRFDTSGPELAVFLPDGRPFLTQVELGDLAEQLQAKLDQQEKEAATEKRRADKEKRRAERQTERAEREKERAEQEAARAKRESERAKVAEAKAAELAAKLRALGIDPES